MHLLTADLPTSGRRAHWSYAKVACGAKRARCPRGARVEPGEHGGPFFTEFLFAARLHTPLVDCARGE